MTYDILGIGGVIFDQILPVTEEYLSTIPGQKGGMEPVDYPTLEKIIAQSGSKPISVPGGSARNTLHGLSRFGEKSALFGMVGNDSLGEKYCALLEEQKIYPLLLKENVPTAIVLSLVTPDGERTMRTFQGASVNLKPIHLTTEIFLPAKIVHLEGYALFNEGLAEQAMRLAKQSGAKVSFDLASFEIVKHYKEHILHLLENYVDFIFANEEEIFALTGKKDEQSGCEFLAELCEVATVLMGPKGCWVKKGTEQVHCPAYPVQPVDTTGAGDLFTSGFLHGALRGYPIEVCAHYGAIAGRAVVQVMGTIIPHDQWEEIYQKMKRDSH